MPEITTLFVLNMWQGLGCTKVPHGVLDWMSAGLFAAWYWLVVISGVTPSSGMEAPMAEMEVVDGWKSGRKTYLLKMRH